MFCNNQSTPSYHRHSTFFYSVKELYFVIVSCLWVWFLFSFKKLWEKTKQKQIHIPHNSLANCINQSYNDFLKNKILLFATQDLTKTFICFKYNAFNIILLTLLIRSKRLPASKIENDNNIWIGNIVFN